MIFSIVLILAVTRATTAQYQQPNFDPTQFAPPDDSGISSRYNYFDLELLEAFDQTNNYVISPASIKATLSMIYEGAGGRSADEIYNRLRLTQSTGKGDVDKTLSALSAKQGPTIFESANAAFISTGFNVIPQYKQILEQAYKTHVESVDFTNLQAVATINNWVKTITKNRISEIVNLASVGPDTKLIIANALYFKGTWKNEFDEKNTKIECFYPQNDCEYVRMMQSIDNYNYKYINDLDAHAVEIPYSGGEYAMMLLVPGQTNTVEALQKDMQHQKFSSIVGVLEPAEVTIKMPKFEISFTGDIVQILQQMQINEIFGDRANLSGITNGQIKVGSIFHKAKLEVNEKGSTAVAATGVIVIPLMGSPGSRVLANRPFLFFIYHINTKTIIFEGRYNKPSEYIDPPIKPHINDRNNINSVPVSPTQFNQVNPNTGAGAQHQNPIANRHQDTSFDNRGSNHAINPGNYNPRPNSQHQASQGIFYPQTPAKSLSNLQTPQQQPTRTGYSGYNQNT